MGTTADKLGYLIDTKKAIKNAIRAKGVYVAEADTFRSYASKIAEIEGIVEEDDAPAVLFIDYDGTPLYSYSADEFLALSEMPELPSKDRLVCEGWNWTLEDAKAQVEQGYWCTIGALYITDDDKTRVYITIDNDYEMSAAITFDENDVYVDWGDGKITSVDVDTSVGYATYGHTYAAKGDYVITIYPQVANKVYTLGIYNYGSTPFRGNIYRKVELGKYVRPSSQMFVGCPKLETITVPKNTYIPNNPIVSCCSSLKAMVLPKGKGVTFSNCFGLRALSLANTATSITVENTSIERLAYPSSVTSVASTYNAKLSQVQLTHTLSSLTMSYCPKVTFPAMIQASTIGNCTSSFIKNVSASTLGGGTSQFEGCMGLKKFSVGTSNTIPQSCFRGCVSLEEAYFGDGATVVGSNAFSGCVSLKSVRLPNTITSLDSSVFANCVALEEVVIPDGVTSIPSFAFSGCLNLKSIVLGSSVASIGNNALYNCPSLSYIFFPPAVASLGANSLTLGNDDPYCMRVLDFSKHTKVPSLGSSALYRTKSVIVVPNDLAEAWAAAWGMAVTPFHSNVVCKGLEITPRYVSGNRDTVVISYVAHCEATNFYGEFEDDVTFSGMADVYIGKNETSETVVKEASFTYEGYTVTFEVEQGAYVENCIVCKYNATTTTSATTLMYSSFSNYSSYFSSMIVDGVETTIGRTYTFPSLGEHEVIFKIADGVSITTPYRMFYDCSNLSYVDCTECDLSEATSTSSSAGTAYMFYNCKGLKTIIMPSTVSYLGYYMFGYCSATTSFTIKADVAPAASSYAFGYSTTYSTYIGYTSRQKGTNKFYVPIGSTGYDASTYSPLFSTTYCGFTKEEVEF